jgi:hypothetical protein
MKQEEAIEFMWKENVKSFKGIQWEEHRTIRILHDKLIRKIYDDFKLELEAEYKRGWKDRATQSDLESRTCKSRTCENCNHREFNGEFENDVCKNINSLMLEYEISADFGCNKWEQK